MRRFAQPPIPGKSYKRRPGIYVILPLRGGILCTFQGGMHQEFQLPGGGIDPGEHPIPALHREVMEETGWLIDRPRFVTRYKLFTHMPEYGFWAEKICSIYVARPVRKIGPPLEVDHTDVWLPVEAAVEQLAPAGDRAAVAEYFGLI